MVRRIMEAVTTEILKRYNLKNVCDINNGNCEYWANMVAERIPNTIIGETPTRDWVAGWPGHFWIKIKGENGLYYDAESLEGVKHWRQLKIFAYNRHKKTQQLKISLFKL